MTSTCNLQVDPVLHHIEYPFDFAFELCRNSTGHLVFFEADVSVAANFFVATGIVSFLFCLAILVVYIWLDDWYRSKNGILTAEFSLMMLAVICLAGTVVWSIGTTTLTQVTNARNVIDLCGFNCSTVLSTGPFMWLYLSLVISMKTKIYSSHLLISFSF